jgi:hypothetical protein
MEFQDLTMLKKIIWWLDENKIFVAYWLYRFATLFPIQKISFWRRKTGQQVDTKIEIGRKDENGTEDQSTGAA